MKLTKPFVLKFLALIGLAVSVVWMFVEPGWGQFIGIITASSTYIGVEVKLTPKGKSHDALLLKQLLEELPSKDPTVIFLAEHDFGNPYRFDLVGKLDVFVERWKDAEHEFTNKKLNKLRLRLLSRIEQLLEQLNQHAGPDPYRDLISIGMRDMEDRPEIFELRRKLNKLATDAFQAHQELIRQARRKLPLHNE